MTNSEAQREDKASRAAWISPTVKRIRAGDAESGFDRTVSDGYATFS